MTRNEIIKDASEFTQLMNLASEKLGARATSCSDEFFASMHNLVKPGRGIFIEGKYTEQGKWMDGWESRRKRTSGHDWCIIKLGASGAIEGIDVDTNHFLGNHPPHCSVEACFDPDNDVPSQPWTEILAKMDLNPGSQHFFDIESTQRWSHIKLHIYPDGGVARLKVYGHVMPDWQWISESTIVDLASAILGGKAILCNDMFFSHMDNLLMPDKGVDMGDGWETKRNRTPNNRDWVIIRLGHPGEINRIVLDTSHFKGNYPDSFSLDAALSPTDDLSNAQWVPLLNQQKLMPDHEHLYEEDILSHDTISHVRMNIYPDGGVSRLRLFGKKKNMV